MKEKGKKVTGTVFGARGGKKGDKHGKRGDRHRFRAWIVEKVTGTVLRVWVVEKGDRHRFGALVVVKR